LASRKILTIAEEDPRGNFIERNKNDILNEYYVSRKEETDYNIRSHSKIKIKSKGSKYQTNTPRQLSRNISPMGLLD